MKDFSNLSITQKKAVKFFASHKYAACFAGTGSGKTATFLNVVDNLMFEKLDVSSILVVSTKNISDGVWSDEANNWDNLKHLKIINLRGDANKRLELLAQKADIYTISISLLGWLLEHRVKFGCVILDESTLIKSPSSNARKNAFKLQAKYKYILTATPNPNKIVDLYSQIKWLDGGKTLGKTLNEFRGRFMEYEKGYLGFPIWRAKKGAIKKIAELLKPFSMILDPIYTLPVTHVKVNFDLPEDVYTQYKRFDTFGDELELDNPTLQKTNTVNKLLQWSTGAYYNTKKEVIEVHNEKIEKLKTLVCNKLQGKNVLIAYGYKHEIPRLMQSFPKAHVYQGKKSQDLWNTGKIPVMLIHPKSGGHGVNLQFGGSDLIWFSGTYAYELYKQLNGRLARPGQKNEVNIYELCANGTRDKEVYNNLKRKSDELEEFISYFRN